MLIRSSTSKRWRTQRVISSTSKLIQSHLKPVLPSLGFVETWSSPPVGLPLYPRSSNLSPPLFHHHHLHHPHHHLVSFTPLNSYKPLIIWLVAFLIHTIIFILTQPVRLPLNSSLESIPSALDRIHLSNLMNRFLPLVHHPLILPLHLILRLPPLIATLDRSSGSQSWAEVRVQQKPRWKPIIGSQTKALFHLGWWLRLIWSSEEVIYTLLMIQVSQTKSLILRLLISSMS